jgi:NAD(P)H-dependent FMN reductase
MQDVITIIAGTNRPDSMTEKLASVYYKLLREENYEVQLLSLKDKQVWERGSEMIALEHQYLVPATKFVFVMPEYNASFPGILKMMMDNSDIKQCWWNKKAALTGISDGRAGNLRGVEHMTAILNYLKVNVLYNKILLSKIKEEVASDGAILKSQTMSLIQTQINELLQF